MPTALSFTQKVFFASEKLKAFVTSLNSEFNKRRHKSLTFTIGAPGVAGCNFNFASVANTTAQPIDLGTIIPAFAQISSVIAKTDVAFSGTGITAFGVTGGTTSGGTELFASADLIAKDAINQPAVGAGYTLIAVSKDAKKIYIGGAPTGGNWSALTAGKISVFVNYMDNVNA